MRGAKRLHSLQGFTLIEVMLAMVITAFVALLAYNGLSAAITAGERHELQAEKLAGILLPLTVMERDIRNAVRRQITDEYDELVGALTGGALDQYILRLTRSGWDNPRGLRRGELQRVRYVLENEELWRESWSVLDRTSEEEGQQRTLLLKGVLNFELAFLDPGAAGTIPNPIPLGGEWVETWDEKVMDRMPLAVQIKLELEGFGELQRVYSIPST